MLSVNELCKARDDKGCYRECKIVALNKISARIELDGVRLTLPYCALWKKKKTVKNSSFSKPSDNKYTKRIGRYRKIDVVSTEFRYIREQYPIQFVPNFWGDFNQMMQNQDLRESGLFLFNDNHEQWDFARRNPTTYQSAGGGNASIRPWECQGHAMGIPTGPYSSLYQVCILREGSGFGDNPQPFTAKQVIDMAFDRIVRHCIEHPTKSTLYYSASKDSDRIGLGIFAHLVSEDVVDYITQKLRGLAEKFRQARVNVV
tara:strand:- start:1210 stop:1986 length:777 start_codon:yes stop_codon:yes gene_type:complete